MQGTIIKGIGGFYTVDAHGERYVCKARGRFRIGGMTPMIGDQVCFEAPSSQDGFLLEILPRRNALTRPAVANVDQLVWIFSAGKPAVDRCLGDKLLTQAARLNVDALICVNKCDLIKAEDEAQWRDDYAPAGYDFLCVSAKTKRGIETLREKLSGKTSCFAGQSAVGKTSLINALCPSYALETGDMSEKIGRGKHTTRHVELLTLTGGGFLADTPGFSLMDLTEIEPEHLGALYPEFEQVLDNCRFTHCLHESEPDCAVKAHLHNGGISRARYESYLSLLRECKERKKHKYD